MSHKKDDKDFEYEAQKMLSFYHLALNDSRRISEVVAKTPFDINAFRVQAYVLRDTCERAKEQAKLVYKMDRKRAEKIVYVTEESMIQTFQELESTLYDTIIQVERQFGVKI